MKKNQEFFYNIILNKKQSRCWSPDQQPQGYEKEQLIIFFHGYNTRMETSFKK